MPAQGCLERSKVLANTWLDVHESIFRSALQPQHPTLVVNKYILQDQTLPQNTPAADFSWLEQQHCCLARVCWMQFMNGNRFRGWIFVGSNLVPLSVI